VALVAVKKLSTSGILPSPCVAAGKVSAAVPIRMTLRKLMINSCGGVNFVIVLPSELSA